MKAEELIQKLDTGAADKVLESLYGEATPAKERLRSLILTMTAAFPETEAEIRVFSAPGRTELGGNHTDHNHGRVVAASIQLDALACVSPRSDGKVVFRSGGYPDAAVDLTNLARRDEETGTTESLIRGIANEFSTRGVKIGGFTAVASNTVLSGSGLSSSAAIEVLMGTIFDGLYGTGKMGAVEVAIIGQRAENLYFGKPCGLMDQVACASGGAVAIDFEDPENPVVQAVPFDPAAAGWALCVVDTGGSHADLTADYASIPADMKAIAAELGVQVLRESSKEKVLSETVRLRKKFGDRAVLRALHFFEENDRAARMLEVLQAAAAAAESNDGSGQAAAIDSFLTLVDQSGTSSWEWLQNVWTPKAPEEQGVALAQALTREFLKENYEGRGTCRVHGGGFAGTIQAYIPKEAMKEYVRWMGSVFGEKSVTPLRIRGVGATELRF